MNVDPLMLYVIGGLVLLVTLNQWFPNVLKWAGYAVLNLIIGGVLLFLFNLIGNAFDFYIPVNPITAFVIGFLRLPGLLVLVTIKLLVVG